MERRSPRIEFLRMLRFVGAARASWGPGLRYSDDLSVFPGGFAWRARADRLVRFEATFSLRNSNLSSSDSAGAFGDSVALFVSVFAERRSIVTHNSCFASEKVSVGEQKYQAGNYTFLAGYIRQYLSSQPDRCARGRSWRA